MKRIVSLFIALVMVLSCTAALADGDFGITMEQYLNIANQLNGNAGLEVEWIDKSEEKGYACYQGIVTNLSMDNSIWVYEEPVSTVEAVYVLNLKEDSEAQGNEFGQMAAIAVMCAWVAQHMADEDVQTQLLNLQSNLVVELSELFAPMYNLTEDTLANGVRNVGTFCGVPAVFMLEGDPATMQCVVYIMASYNMDYIENYN